MILYWIILIVGCIAVFSGGYLIGSKIEENRYEEFKKEDMWRTVQMLKKEYQRGYHDGFMTKVTPNQIRKVFGLEPIEDEDYVEHRLEDTEETA